MALKPGSEPPDTGAPEDYVHDHPREHPSDWGWHGEWGRWARVAGWVCVIILLLMITATHYNGAGHHIPHSLVSRADKDRDQADRVERSRHHVKASQ